LQSFCNLFEVSSANRTDSANRIDIQKPWRFLKQSIRVFEKFAFKVRKSGIIYGLFVYICQAFILAN